MAEATRIAVSGDSPYDVVVGHGLAPLLPEALGDGVRPREARAAQRRPAERGDLGRLRGLGVGQRHQKRLDARSPDAIGECLRR